MAKLTGKVALITGAAVGLGEGIATAYAKYGAKLCMVDLSPEVEKTAEKLRKEYNAEIVTCVANVADPDADEGRRCQGCRGLWRSEHRLLQRRRMPPGSL